MRQIRFLIITSLFLWMSAFSQEVIEDKPFERWKWFHEQRAYPNDTIKDGYLLEAFQEAQVLQISFDQKTSPLSWTPLGPAPGGLYSGRVPAIAVHPTNSNIVYTGAANGGVWKTTNSGSNWTSITGDLPTSASGSLAIDPVNPNVVYYGTGEPYYFSYAYGGAGIFKSVDGGINWSNIGLTNERSIRKILINPQNTNIITVAASGGVYRSTNGGSFWTKTSTFSEVWDTDFDPLDPNIVYAGASSVYKSTDGGINWTKLSNGIPTSTSRLVLAVAPSLSSTLYVLISNTKFYKSTNAGASWFELAIPSDLFNIGYGSQGWYDIAIGVSPADQNIVLIGGIRVYRSTDGGNSWTNISSGQHPDCHAINFGPKGSNIVYIGTDGGMNRSTDNGATFTRINNDLPITQFYSVGLDYLTPLNIWGGTQDNGLQKSKLAGGLAWFELLGGDYGQVVVDYTNSKIAYATQANGSRRRIQMGIYDGMQSNVTINNGITENGAWVTPIIMHPDTPAILYTATSKIYRTTNQGDLWAPTASSFPWGGSLIRQLAIPKTSSQTIYASPGSTLYKSTDAGLTWTNISTGLPGRIITSIVPHKSIPSLVYLTVSGSGSAHIFKSTNAGSSWESINGNFPLDLPTNTLAIDPFDVSKLYIGTDLGVWFTTDGGNQWLKDMEFPNTAVLMADITSDNYLVASTHGRSMFKAQLGSGGPSVTVISPNGSENWIASSLQNIRWTSNDVNNIKIEYSTNNGTNWSTVIASTPASGGTYSWTIPNTPTTQGRVRISDAANASVNDISDNAFNILPPQSITVTSPNGGEVWNVSNIHNITWSPISIVNVKIEYTTNNGTSWTTIIASTPASAGTFSWTVPNTPTTQGRVRISDAANASINDISDNVFSIVAVPTVTVLVPNGGESWAAGTNQNITWSFVSITNVKIEYTTNNGSSWLNIVSDTLADAVTYSWTVPNTPTTQARVRVSDGANASVNDISDNVFTIQPPQSITVTSPNGGETWNVSSVQNITWSSTSIANVKIEYSTNNGTNWAAIIASTPASAGTYSWTVPNTPTIQGRVRISDAANASVNDISDNVFSIAAVPTVTVLVPNGGESWVAGTNQNITWSSVSVTNVKIEYTTNNGTNWTTIIASTPASAGTYAWTVPNTPTTQGRVRISDTSNTSLNDISNNVFTIVLPSYVTVTSPNGGENWRPATTQNITWHSNGLNNIKIRYSANNGSSWNNIVQNTSAATGSYSWVVPNTPTNQAIIQISNASGTISDVSDNTFTISTGAAITVNTPNGGEAWHIGTTQYITWISAGITNVKIEYSTNSGSSWNIVATSIPANQNSYIWTIPNTPTTQALIRISDVTNSTINDVSNNEFSIAPPPSITLLTPNGGERLIEGNKFNITWNSTGISNVRIEYLADFVSLWSLIEVSVPASPPNYTWTIPSLSTIKALVRISDASDLEPSDQSDGYFTIITYKFLSNLVVTDNNMNRDTLVFGTAFGATNLIDSLYGEKELLPKPPSGTFDVRWKILGTNGTKRDIRDTLSSINDKIIYRFEFQTGSGGYPISIRWGNLGKGVWQLKDTSAQGTIVNFRMYTNSSYILSNPSVTSLELVYTPGVTKIIDVSSGWNLLSIPLDVTSNARNDLFPLSNSSAYKYTDIGYTSIDPIENKIGFWLKFPESQPVEHVGVEKSKDTLTVSSGWNMIGSISFPLSVVGIIQVPPNIVLSRYYGFKNGYVISDTIHPGRGYWVKTSEPGSLILLKSPLK